MVRPTSLAARMAGQRGFIPISTNVIPAASVAKHWETYCAGAQEAGRPMPDRSIWSVSRNIFVGETNEQAWDFARNSQFGASWEYLINILKFAKMLDLAKLHPDMPDEEVTVEWVLKNICIVGDVDECTRQLQEVVEVTGGFWDIADDRP